MYLTASRPDIIFAVCAYARFQVTPKMSHLHAVKRIFRYLKGQPKLGLWYPIDSQFDLEAFSNSGYTGASLDRKSTTGGCQFFGKRLISWQCKKQTIVANSTTEAEYVAAANCCGQTLLLHHNHYMADLKFVNQYNMVGCLEKSEENVEFHQIVDFLSTCSINYALAQIHAIIDGYVVVISESSVRSCLLFNDEDDTPLSDSMLVQNQAPEGEGSTTPPEPQPTPSTSQPNVSEPLTEPLQTETPPPVFHEPQTKASFCANTPISNYISKKKKDFKIVERAITIDASLDAAHDSDNIIRNQTTAMPNTRSERVLEKPNEPPLSEGQTFGSGEGNMEYHFELTDNVPPTPHDSPLSGGNTPGSDEGRMELIEELMETFSTARPKVSTATPSTPPTTTTVFDDEDVTMAMAQTLIKMKEVKDKGVEFRNLDEDFRHQKRNQYFIPIDSKKEAQKSGKRLKRVAGSYTTQKSPKKPKVMKFAKDVTEEEAAKYEKEKEKLRLSLKIIPNDDSEVNYEPLPRKFPIVNWEYQLLGKMEAKDMEVFKLTKADGSSSYHGNIQAFLRRLDRHDLNDLYSLVQERFQDHPLEGHDLLLWGDLRMIFDPDEKDELWMNQLDWKLLKWKLHENYGVHTLFMDGTPMEINMLVEKRYPLIKELLEKMLNLTLGIYVDGT
ncbi:hypothetical protein Tco_0596837 [Tanacetum coccineum]